MPLQSWVAYTRFSTRGCITPSLVLIQGPLSALRFSSNNLLPPLITPPLSTLPKRVPPEPASEGDLAHLRLNGWSSSNSSKGDCFVSKDLRFRNFSEAWAFMNMVALKAAQMNHVCLPLKM